MESFHSKSSLKFNSVSELDVKKEILDLSSKKANIKGDIPAKILNNSISAYLSELIIFINNCLKNGVFPDDLKLVDITPIFKKEDSLNKKTIYLSAYWLIYQKYLKGFYTNKLIVLWKTSFHLTYAGSEQITIPSTRFWKWSKTGKKQLENGEKVGVIFMDLSKAFDTINHSLILGKLKAYDFSNQALSLLQSYLCSRFPRA